MANFNSSKWYQIQLGGSGQTQSLSGTGLYNAGKGAVFFEVTNTSDPQQMWQMYPFNSSYYVLRTSESGQYGYMTAKVGDESDGTNTGNTVPEISNVTLADNSMFWSISPWGDGTFYLTNAANGTGWHLQDNSNSLLEMSSDIAAPQSGQRFTFNVQGDIVKRPGFKSVLLPAALSSTTSTSSSGTATPTGATPSPSSSDKSSGLSTGAKAGIGAGVGIVAVIALLILGFFFLRRRKTRAQSPSSHPLTADYSGERKSMMHTEPQELSSFTDTSDMHKKTIPTPQELDPTSVGAHEMEGGEDIRRNGSSVSPYRPGVDNEQKAVMAPGFSRSRENVAVEMDAHQHPSGVTGLSGN